MTTKTIGIRAAKARFGRLLRDVQVGHEWVITKRGRPIAKLVPMPGSLPLSVRIRRLEDSGLIEPVCRQVRELPPPLPLEIDLAQEWLTEDSGAW